MAVLVCRKETKSIKRPLTETKKPATVTQAITCAQYAMSFWGLQVLGGIFFFNVGVYLLFKAMSDPTEGRVSDAAMFSYGFGGFLCLAFFIFVTVIPFLV